MRHGSPPLTLAACVILVAASMCISLGEDEDAGPVEGVTLILDFGDARAPVYGGNLSVWEFEGGGNNTEYDFSTGDNGGRAVMVFNDIYSDDGTVLGITRAAADIAGMDVRTESYSHGLFVEEVGGVEADKDGDNWLYWLEGVYGNLASDRRAVDPGELLIWRYIDPADVDGDSGTLEAVGLDPEEVGA